MKMQFRVEKAVLDSGVKILFAVMENIDNTGENAEWNEYREKRLTELYTLRIILYVQRPSPTIFAYN